MNSYHNTVMVDMAETAERELKAKGQDADVLSAMERISGDITPDRILSRLFFEKPKEYDKVPITSVRRSLNTLIKQKKVEYAMNDDASYKKVMGRLGHKVRVVKLKSGAC